MKVALIVSENFTRYTNRIIKENINYIDIENIVYSHYTEVIEIVERIQSDYDGLMFMDLSLYNFIKSHVEETTVWGYFPLDENSLSLIMLKALYSNENIRNISIDTFSKDMINEVYKAIGIDINSINIMHHKIDYHSKKIGKDAINFHYNNLKQNEDICIITALNDVKNEFDKKNINTYITVPTKSVIINSFKNLYLKYENKLNLNSTIVVISIQIEFPSDYSIMSSNEYYYIKEKNKITEIIYKLANKIEGAVMEVSSNRYIVVCTRNILDEEINDYTKIELLEYISEISLNKISMGIGYGNTVREAKNKSTIAMRKSSECKDENATYIIYKDGKMRGPIRSKLYTKENKNNIDDKMIKISERTEISIKKILSIYDAIDVCKKNKFTAIELSKQCNISYRTINRIINKLERKGYVSIIGKNVEDGSGRPKRLIEFNF